MKNCRRTENGFECGGKPRFKKGDPRPKLEMDCREWAQVQHEAGQPLMKCPDCEGVFFVFEGHFKCSPAQEGEQG